MTNSRPALPGPAAARVPAGLLVAVFLGAFMALLDLSIVTVALPAMQASLRTGFSSVQWVIDGYTLALAALLLTAGSLGDRYGRRRLYLCGIAVFTAGSALCAAAPDTGLLIAGRVIQGIGATSLIPGSLSILTQAFPEPGQRARMFGLWGGFGSLAVALGPVAGGVLVDTVGWRAIFLVNIPVGAVAILLGARSIPQSADPAHAAVDLPGQIAAVGWLTALTFGLIQGGQSGWTAAVAWVPLAVAVAGLAGFLWLEGRGVRPMLPLEMFRAGAFAVANLASFGLGFGAYSVFAFLSLYLQDVLGYPALSAGLRYLPLCGAISVTSVLAGRLTGRFGAALPMIAGYTAAGAALLAICWFGPGTGYPVIAAVFVVLGAGMGLAISPTTAAAMGAAPRERSGIASAVVNATRQAGNTVGVAILGVLITAVATAHLTAALRARHLTASLARATAAAVVSAHGAPGVPSPAPTKAGSGTASPPHLAPAAGRPLDPATTHPRDPAAPRRPDPATTHAPDPATAHAPDPATVHAPDPATVHAPDPATVHRLYRVAFSAGLHVAVLTAGIVSLLAALLTLAQSPAVATRLTRHPTPGDPS